MYFQIALNFIAEAFFASLLFYSGFFFYFEKRKNRDKLPKRNIFYGSIITAAATGITRVLMGFIFGFDLVLKLIPGGFEQILFFGFFPAFFAFNTYKRLR